MKEIADKINEARRMARLYAVDPKVLRTLSKLEYYFRLEEKKSNPKTTRAMARAMLGLSGV